ncbi:glycosyltransferase family 4 protein [Flavihumibacter solisilvae]|uniref:Glycosyl transferase family 1 domain-containing protein n=1 Tax=Flavihumibacter solisilvae TaxID=1349421 RepID=A0A0C1LG40_9BACT|nr:glycosyltransferase family 4 protein [Flavihumibacter solisilvae]KIC94313.1 hypothetical protein OI18_11800 [Flavihumibacter solisilvae]
MDKKGMWIGPHYESRGGVASVIKTYHENGFFDDSNILFIPTVEDGDKWTKFTRFLQAITIFIRNIRHAKFVHIHVSSDASFFRKFIFMTVARMRGMSIIVHLHSSSFPSFYQRSGSIGKKMIRSFFRNSSRILVLSDEMKTFVHSLDPVLDPVIFPNPVNYSGQSLNGHTPHAPYLLFLGRINPQKGLVELLEAFKRVSLDYPTWKLVIGGSGEESFLDNEIRKRGIEANVIRKGWVSGNEKDNLIREAAMLVLPSYGEGQSIAILEAMAAGLPVIATSVGGNTFIIDHMKSGILVPMGDTVALENAIRKLIEDPGLGRKIAAEAQEKIAAQFKYEKVREQLLHIYHEK